LPLTFLSNTFFSQLKTARDIAPSAQTGSLDSDGGSGAFFIRNYFAA
jgi:hypothetical protein